MWVSCGGKPTTLSPIAGRQLQGGRVVASQQPPNKVREQLFLANMAADDSSARSLERPPDAASPLGIRRQALEANQRSVWLLGLSIQDSIVLYTKYAQINLLINYARLGRTTQSPILFHNIALRRHRRLLPPHQESR